ncbi:MAG TPA: acyl carrier protein [Longimicrobiales bacterium]|nr:acyl carrier protein [Longimicrobiales bacterium]
MAADETDAGRDLRVEIRTYIVENLDYQGDAENLEDDESFLESGMIDSRAFVEETYDITVEDVELVPDNLDSVGKLVAFIERKTGKQA